MTAALSRQMPPIGAAVAWKTHATLNTGHIQTFRQIGTTVHLTVRLSDSQTLRLLTLSEAEFQAALIDKTRGGRPDSQAMPDLLAARGMASLILTGATVRRPISEQLNTLASAVLVLSRLPETNPETTP